MGWDLEVYRDRIKGNGPYMAAQGILASLVEAGGQVLVGDIYLQPGRTGPQNTGVWVRVSDAESGQQVGMSICIGEIRPFKRKKK